MTDDQAVVAEDLRVAFGSTRALDGVSFCVPRGTVLGLLGPNGASKTTAVRVLTTLRRPDAGRAEVAGVDVLRDPGGVRRRIGLAGSTPPSTTTHRPREPPAVRDAAPAARPGQRPRRRDDAADGEEAA